jgi:hypothetical protein
MARYVVLRVSYVATARDPIRPTCGPQGCASADRLPVPGAARDKGHAMIRVLAPRTHDRAVRLAGASLMVALAVLAFGTAAETVGLFTDNATVPANAFDAGTIDLTTSPSSALISLPNLMPGDSVNGTLTIANAGTGALRYAMTSASSNLDGKGLAAQMTLVIRTEGTSCGTFDGAAVYTGSLSAAAFGDVTAGAQAGDRSLAAGSSEKLCFHALLPAAAGNPFQGATTVTTFTFGAEQTANNP